MIFPFSCETIPFSCLPVYGFAFCKQPTKTCCCFILCQNVESLQNKTVVHDTPLPPFFHLPSPPPRVPTWHYTLPGPRRDRPRRHPWGNQIIKEVATLHQPAVAGRGRRGTQRPARLYLLFTTWCPAVHGGARRLNRNGPFFPRWKNGWGGGYVRTTWNWYHGRTWKRLRREYFFKGRPLGPFFSCF